MKYNTLETQDAQYKRMVINTANDEISEEAVKARREYANTWRKKNPEKVKEYNRRHWEKVAAAKKAESTTI